MQDAEVVFDVLTDLEDIRIFQERLENTQGVIEWDLLQLIAEIEPFGGVAERDIAGAVGRGRQRHTDQF